MIPMGDTLRICAGCSELLGRITELEAALWDAAEALDCAAEIISGYKDHVWGTEVLYHRGDKCSKAAQKAREAVNG